MVKDNRSIEWINNGDKSELGTNVAGVLVYRIKGK